MFQPLRLRTRRSSSVETSARKPSHLSSKDHPEPEGSGPGRDNIGSGSRRPATLPVVGVRSGNYKQAG
jgi:hypothetical protein